MFLSPLVLSAILTGIAVILAALSEQSDEPIRDAAIDSSITLTVAMFAFTFTFGVIGVGMLWALAQRSPVAWAATGLVAGSLSGMLLSELALTAGGPAVVIFTGAASVALFLLIRGIAGIQDDEIDG